jgi:hypothetical protein
LFAWAAAFPTAINSSKDAVAPLSACGRKKAIECRKCAVYDEHDVSVTIGIENVAVSPGYGTHMSRRVNSKAAVVSVTLTITAVS